MKVIFLHLCVCLQGGLPQCMLGYTIPPNLGPGADTPWTKSRHTIPQTRSRHPPPDEKQTPRKTKADPLGSRADTPWTKRRHTPRPKADIPSHGRSYCCGRYASYWNVFLLALMLRPSFPSELFYLNFRKKTILATHFKKN